LHLTWITFLLLVLVFIFIPKWNNYRSLLLNAMLAASTIFITVSMVLFPQEAFEASLHGFDIWWNIVFPALLPFFIMAQILIGLGIVHMMGVFLEPIMRPLFNVPGVGSFVLAMGLASGFPLGAILTADMRRKQMLGKIEAERLLSFVNTADPLFMFGAVAVGMIGVPETGILIASAHYLSTISVGLIMRFYQKNKTYIASESLSRQKNILYRSLQEMSEARKKDGRPMGQLMGDAIKKSIETMLLIGGFIILFSVIIRILTVVGLVKHFSVLINFLLNLLGLDTGLAPAVISGLLEIDLGCQFAASSHAPMQDILIVTGFIVAWSGVSVHAQVASIISDTDLSILPYIWARGIHSVLAGLYTYLLIAKPFSLLENITIPAFYQTLPSSELSFWWLRTAHMSYQLIFFVITLAFISVFIFGINKLRNTPKRQINNS